uniref:(northern house mosquito) hypothetical protein n=1 Tax=Culex pipiens TaxID=7175 RepID=A0A8D8IW55_CULPI
MRTGLPPPADIGVPRGLPGRVHLPRVDPPEAQVLGQERRDPAQGHGHGGAAGPRRGVLVEQRQLLRAQHNRRQAVDRAVRHDGGREPRARAEGHADVQDGRRREQGSAPGRGVHFGPEQTPNALSVRQVDRVHQVHGLRFVRGVLQRERLQV